jgi:hypothetical protein
VHRRFRIDVVKGDHLLVFPHDASGNLASGDFLENRHVRIDATDA